MAKEIIEKIGKIERAAKDIIDRARAEALGIVKNAEAEAKEMIASRTLLAEKSAEERIMVSEKEALSEKSMIEESSKKDIRSLRARTEKRLPAAVEFILEKAKKALCR